MAKSRRGPAPNPGSPVPIRIESCPEKGSCTVRFLATYCGTFCHFVKRGVRPAPCMGDECPTALHKSRKTWKGYAPALLWRGGEYQDWTACVFEITETLNEALEDLHLRGSEWLIERKLGDTGKMEVCGEFRNEVPESELLPPFDVFPMVSRMYGYLPMQWGVKCHIPKRLRFEPVKASPPKGIDALHSGATQSAASAPQLDDDTKLQIGEIRRGIFPGDDRSSFDLEGKRKRNGKEVRS